MEKDCAAYALPFCLWRIDRVHFCDQKGLHYILSNPYTLRTGDARLSFARRSTWAILKWVLLPLQPGVAATQR